VISTRKVENILKDSFIKDLNSNTLDIKYIKLIIKNMEIKFSKFLESRN